MGKREEQQKQEPLWIAHAELAAAPGLEAKEDPTVLHGSNTL